MSWWRRNTDTYTDGYNYINAETYTYPENCANTEASSDAAAETLVVFAKANIIAIGDERWAIGPARLYHCPCTLPRRARQSQE